MSPVLELAWSFYAIAASNSFGFTWHWRCRRSDGVIYESRKPFAYYHDCVADARSRGYIGGFPPGPSTPLNHLPPVAPARPVPGIPRQAAESHPVPDMTFAECPL